MAQFPPYLDPLMFAQFFQIPAMYDWQSELIRAASKPKARVVCSTCNEAGKTNILIPLIGLAYMCVFPGCTVFSTAGSEEQIKGQLFKYLDAKLKPYRDWKVTGDLEVFAPQIGGFPRARWIGRVPKDAKTAEGYHGSWICVNGKWVWVPVVVIIDEAKSADESIFELADRIDPDLLFVISTPGEDSGPFYEAVESDGIGKEDVWTYRRKISWLDCPHLLTPERRGIRDRLIDKYGEKSSFIQSFLFGRFQRSSDENAVFTDIDIANLRASMGIGAKQITNVAKGNIVRAALEFSGGGDEQIIKIARGGEEIFSDAFREEDTARLARLFVDTLLKYNVPPSNCVADNGGLGLAVIDNMESMGYRPIRRYMNNQDAIDKKEFADRMTEDTYRFKEILKNNGIRLHKDLVLLEQARRRRFVMDNHNKVKLEPKPQLRKRGESSPDRLDALVMLFSEWYNENQAEDTGPYESHLEKKAQTLTSGRFSFAGMIKQPSLSDIRPTIFRR